MLGIIVKFVNAYFVKSMLQLNFTYINIFHITIFLNY